MSCADREPNPRNLVWGVTFSDGNDFSGRQWCHNRNGNGPLESMSHI